MSGGQIAGLFLAFIIPITFAIGMCIWIGRNAKGIDSTVVGAAGYGFLGYLWQKFLYGIVCVMLLPILFKVAGLHIVVQIIIVSIVCGVFVTISLIWALYLTNQRQKSLYRSAAVGVGFMAGDMVWMYAINYGEALYSLLPQTLRTYLKWFEITKDDMMGFNAMSTAEMYIFAINSVFLILIFASLALIMQWFGDRGKKRMGAFAVLGAWALVTCIRTLVMQYLPRAAVHTIETVLYLILAGYGLWVISNFLRTDIVKLLPDKKDV